MSKRNSLSSFTLTNQLGDLRDLLRDLGESEYATNRRRAVRIPRSLVLVIQPLDNDLNPVGSLFKAVTRDVSASGLGFLHETPFPTNYVRIGATAQSSAQSIARVCYNKTIFCDELVYLIGVEFID